MPEEYSDRFQTEVINSLQKLVAKSIEHDKRFDSLESRITEVALDLKALAGQFNDVGVLAIKDSGRIDNVEKRVDDLETGIH